MVDAGYDSYHMSLGAESLIGVRALICQRIFRRVKRGEKGQQKAKVKK